MQLAKASGWMYTVWAGVTAYPLYGGDPNRYPNPNPNQASTAQSAETSSRVAAQVSDTRPKLFHETQLTQGKVVHSSVLNEVAAEGLDSGVGVGEGVWVGVARACYAQGKQAAACAGVYNY